MIGKKCLAVLCFIIVDLFNAKAQITGIKIIGDPCIDFTIPMQALGTSSSPYFFWNFDDPSSGVDDTITITGTSPSPFPTHTFSGPGIYNVCVSLKEPGQPVTTVCRVLNVGLCCTGIILSSDTCLQNNIAFSLLSDSTINSVSWNFGDPSSGANNGSTALTPTHLFSAAGTYTVTASVTASCGTYNASKTITIVNCAPASCSLATDATASNTSCALNNGSIAINILNTGTPPYNYSVNNGNPQSGNQFSNLASGNYTVITSDGNGCRDTVVVAVLPSTNSLQLNLAAINASCFGFNDGSVSATVTGGNPSYTYLWSNAATTSSLQNLNSGNYSLIVTDALNCTASASATVSQPIAIPISLGNDTAICGNNAIEIRAPLNFSSYNWNTTEVSSSISVATPGRYSLTVTDMNGCTASDTVLINSSSASVNLGDDISIYQNGEGVAIKPTISGATNAGTYLWSPPQFLSCANCLSPLANPQTTTTYTLVYTDIAGCVATDSITINVLPVGNVIFPNAFSPNGDGVNDVFSALGSSPKEYNLRIFNRWGELVFESSDFDSGWNGTYKGALQPVEVYVYYALVTLQNNKSVQLKGSITLIR